MRACVRACQFDHIQSCHRTEQLTEETSSYVIHSSWLKIKENDSRNMTSSYSFIEIHSDAFQNKFCRTEAEKPLCTISLILTTSYREWFEWDKKRTLFIRYKITLHSLDCIVCIMIVWLYCIVLYCIVLYCIVLYCIERCVCVCTCVCRDLIYDDPLKLTHSLTLLAIHPFIHPSIHPSIHPIPQHDRVKH